MRAFEPSTDPAESVAGTPLTTTVLSVGAAKAREATAARRASAVFIIAAKIWWEGLKVASLEQFEEVQDQEVSRSFYSRSARLCSGMLTSSGLDQRARRLCLADTLDIASKQAAVCLRAR
jgi:hypothetical protein